MPFVSHKDQTKELLGKVVSKAPLHAAWLNTLSFLENCGARKIASCEHPTKVKKEMLKHAAEEFRHAFYLKEQIKKVSEKQALDYRLSDLLGGAQSLHYISRLDLETSKILKSKGFDGDHLKAASYILVTYAIELRAQELYPLYMEVLKEAGSTVTVKSILLEEEEHLAEMEKELSDMPEAAVLAPAVIEIEGKLCKEWLLAVDNAFN